MEQLMNPQIPIIPEPEEKMVKKQQNSTIIVSKFRNQFKHNGVILASESREVTEYVFGNDDNPDAVYYFFEHDNATKIARVSDSKRIFVAGVGDSFGVHFIIDYFHKEDIVEPGDAAVLVSLLIQRYYVNEGFDVLFLVCGYSKRDKDVKIYKIDHRDCGVVHEVDNYAVIGSGATTRIQRFLRRRCTLKNKPGVLVDMRIEDMAKVVRKAICKACSQDQCSGGTLSAVYVGEYDYPNMFEPDAEYNISELCRFFGLHVPHIFVW